jgi:hypothetical protein
MYLTEGCYSPAAKYFGTWLKIRIWIELQRQWNGQDTKDWLISKHKQELQVREIADMFIKTERRKAILLIGHADVHISKLEYNSFE